MKSKSEFIKDFNRTLFNHLTDPSLNGKQLAEYLGMSRMHLHRHLVRYFKCSAGDVIRHTRLQQSLRLLQNDQASISQVAERVGFTDPGYYTRVFRKEYGCTPREMRRQL